MTASVSSPADIVNLSLSRAGFTQRVGNLYDGSAFSKRALDIYGQTRDALLHNADWGFPRRDTNLTLLKTAPSGGYVPGSSPWNPATNPPRPYFFEYAYPGDCIYLRVLLLAVSIYFF